MPTDDTQDNGDNGDDDGDDVVTIDPVAAAMLADDATAPAFGIRLVEAGPDRAVVTMRVRPEMCNGLGVIHGGMTFLLADSAMAFASNSARGADEATFATSASIDWVAPARAGQWLTATATRRHGGGRAALWEVTVTAGDDDRDPGAEIAVFRGRTRRVTRAAAEPT